MQCRKNPIGLNAVVIAALIGSAALGCTSPAPVNSRSNVWPCGSASGLGEEYVFCGDGASGGTVVTR